MPQGDSRHELGRFQRWDVARNKMRYVWRQDKDVSRNRWKAFSGGEAFLKMKSGIFGGEVTFLEIGEEGLSGFQAL